MSLAPLLLALLVAADEGPKGYVCRKADAPPNIDGKLDDSAWRDAPWTDAFVDIKGDAKPRPRYRTRAKMLWDEQFFYIAALMEEPNVWATLTEHDSVIFHDNDFEVFIDPDGDNHEYYEIEINARNTEWDLFLGKPYRDGGPARNEWEIPGLKTGVNVLGTLNDPADSDAGWSVELAIPWKALAEFARRPAPPKLGDQWRVNFSRVEWQVDTVDGKVKKRDGLREDNWVWSPQGAIDMHRPEKWGYVQFSLGDAPLRRDPTAAARDLLMRVYHAQRSFQGREKRWAKTLDELGIAPKEGEPDVKLEATADGFVATAGPVGCRMLSVRQDSKLTESEP